MAKAPDRISKVHDEASKVHDETLKEPDRKQITHVKNVTTSSSDVLPHPKAEERIGSNDLPDESEKVHGEVEEVQVESLKVADWNGKVSVKNF